MKKLFWDKIRILVTDRCNYRCPFCHNEGQQKGSHRADASFKDVAKLIDFIKDCGISEICFSGGEPFLNEDIVKMIRYANDETNCDIACASNLSRISDSQIKELQGTRVKFNIQFPFISPSKFKLSTGTGNLETILSTINHIRECGLEVGLNTVIQSNNKQDIEDIILFSIHNELPLKLLPQIGLDGSDQFLEWVHPIIDQFAVSFIDKKTGAKRWVVEDSRKRTSVLYIDSPCFSHNINECRNYGEIRVLPDMRTQPCLLKTGEIQLELAKGKDFVIQQLRESWNELRNC